MFALLDQFLLQRSPKQLVSFFLSLTAMVGVVDYITGFDVSMGLMYVLPVSLAAWYVGRGWGIGLSFVSSLFWLLANFLTPEGLNFPILVLLWNAATRLGFFTIDAVLLAALHSALERERHLARTDQLTGVANSRWFAEQAMRELELARRNGRSLSLLYFDLDNFKQVNDRHGHAAGDRLLELVGEALRLNLRPGDIAGRLGGDEFAVLLSNADYPQAEQLSRRLVAAIAAVLQHDGLPASASAGVITCLPPPPTLEAMMRTADRLMYSVKMSGKNNLVHEHFTTVSTAAAYQAIDIGHRPTNNGH